MPDHLTRWRSRIERSLSTWEGLTGGADFHEAAPGLRFALQARVSDRAPHDIVFQLASGMWRQKEFEYGLSLAISWFVEELTREKQSAPTVAEAQSRTGIPDPPSTIAPTEAEVHQTLTRLVEPQSRRLVQAADFRRRVARMANDPRVRHEERAEIQAALDASKSLDESPGLERRALLLLTKGMCDFCVIGDHWHYHSPDCPIGQALGHLSDEDTERVATERRAVVKAFEKGGDS